MVRILERYYHFAIARTSKVTGTILCNFFLDLEPMERLQGRTDVIMTFGGCDVPH